MNIKEKNFNLNYREIFESSPGMYILLSPDPQFTILGLTKAYAKATMIEKSKVIGKPLFEVFPANPDNPRGKGYKNLRASLMRVLAHRLPDHMPVMQYDIRKPSGEFEIRWWAPTSTPVFNSKGDMVAIIHEAEDITDFVELKFKELEQTKLTKELKNKTRQMEYELFRHQEELSQAKNKLKMANDNLEEKVKERTADLKKAITARDEFLSIASHELKTPITSLKLQLQIHKRKLKELKGTVDVEVVNKILDFSNLQVNRLTTLVEELLDITRLDSGRLELTYEEFNLKELVFQEVANMNICLAEAPTDQSPILITADKSRIGQVVTNLLSNTIKYGNNRPVEVSALTKSNSAQIIIKDQGIGIPPEKINLIFERFERAVNYTNISGLGLGLYIAREIVKAHRGRIEVKSELGKGSTFTVILPLKPQKNTLPFP